MKKWMKKNRWRKNYQRLITTIIAIISLIVWFFWWKYYQIQIVKNINNWTQSFYQQWWITAGNLNFEIPKFEYTDEAILELSNNLYKTYWDVSQTIEVVSVVSDVSSKNAEKIRTILEQEGRTIDRTFTLSSVTDRNVKGTITMFDSWSNIIRIFVWFLD